MTENCYLEFCELEKNYKFVCYKLIICTRISMNIISKLRRRYYAQLEK